MDSEGTIAIIEDDVAIRDLVSDVLRANGFVVEGYGDSAAFFRQADVPSLDCLILDLMLPGESGLSICQTLRVKVPQLPILMVTAKGDDIDRIIGLECGADDYLPKPFNSRELLARLRAILRRTKAPGQAIESPGAELYRFAGWTLAVDSRDLIAPDGRPVTLSTGEFDLLHALVMHPRRVLSRDLLLDMTRGRMATPYDRAIDVQLSRLRRKLGDDPREPVMIRTVRGDGYLFAPSVLKI
ncbi:response regulator [uncultured Novosphingobium sp.]|uniref:response regulator n=1 Tax=uncultured Novosphingobium sp. TaxID=292277 RepID=UPI002596060B|nr:response regulator [uncultured Novosphingobium sp.]